MGFDSSIYRNRLMVWREMAGQIARKDWNDDDYSASFWRNFDWY